MTADKLNGGSFLLNIWKDLFNVNTFGIKSCAAAVFSFAINRLLFIHGEQVARLDLLSLLWTPPLWRYSYYRDDVRWSDSSESVVSYEHFLLLLLSGALSSHTVRTCQLQSVSLEVTTQSALLSGGLIIHLRWARACSVSCTDSHTHSVTWYIELR